MPTILLIKDYTKENGKVLASGQSLDVTNTLANELIELKIAKTTLPVKKKNRKPTTKPK